MSFILIDSKICLYDWNNLPALPKVAEVHTIIKSLEVEDPTNKEDSARGESHN